MKKFLVNRPEATWLPEAVPGDVAERSLRELITARSGNFTVFGPVAALPNPEPWRPPAADGQVNHETH